MLPYTRGWDGIRAFRELKQGPGPCIYLRSRVATVLSVHSGGGLRCALMSLFKVLTFQIQTFYGSIKKKLLEFTVRVHIATKINNCEIFYFSPSHRNDAVVHPMRS